MTGNGIETGMWKREKCSQFDDLHVALFLADTSCIIASSHVEVSLPLTVLASSMDADDGDCRNGIQNGGLEAGCRNNF